MLGQLWTSQLCYFIYVCDSVFAWDILIWGDWGNFEICSNWSYVHLLFLITSVVFSFSLRYVIYLGHLILRLWFTRINSVIVLVIFFFRYKVFYDTYIHYEPVMIFTYNLFLYWLQHLLALDLWGTYSVFRELNLGHIVYSELLKVWVLAPILASHLPLQLWILTSRFAWLLM